MTGKFPFPDNLSQSELTKKIQEGKFDFSTRVFIDYSERAIDLVKRMLKVDPGRDLKGVKGHLQQNRTLAEKIRHLQQNHLQ